MNREEAWTYFSEVQRRGWVDRMFAEIRRRFMKLNVEYPDARITSFKWYGRQGGWWHLGGETWIR